MFRLYVFCFVFLYILYQSSRIRVYEKKIEYVKIRAYFSDFSKFSRIFLGYIVRAHNNVIVNDHKNRDVYVRPLA